MLTGELNRTVMVAVIAVGMVEMTLHHIVDVIAVRNCLMAAIRSMPVLCIVAVACMAVGAVGGVCSIDLKLMLINMTFMQGMQMPVMEIIGMAIVNDRGMSAIFSMLMAMVLVHLVLLRHLCISFEERHEARISRYWCSQWPFGGMSQAIEDKVQNMLIGQVVEDVLSVPPPADDVVGTKDAQALRDDGNGLTFELRQFGNAGLCLG